MPHFDRSSEVRIGNINPNCAGLQIIISVGSQLQIYSILLIMRLAKGIRTLGRLASNTQFRFCSKKAGDKETQQQKASSENQFIKFLKQGWRQTFPKDEDEIRNKYQKIKQVKRYTEQELKEMQDKIPGYTRTAMVETVEKPEEKKSKFKVSNLIPESVKKKVTETSTFKEYSEFKENLKEYVNTSDSAAVNLGTKVYNTVSQPSSAAKATEHMRQYDKDFSLIDLQKQSTFIFKDAYHQYLENNVQGLEMLCGEQALDMFKSLIKINVAKNVRPKYTEIIHYNNAHLRKTIMSEASLPSFLFQMSFMEIYCMVDAEGKVVDGEDDRIMSSTFQFLLKYSGEYIAELGHPWQITEFRKIDEVKYLI